MIQVSLTVMCMFMVEKAGRRPLLLYGTAGLCVSLFLIVIFRVFTVRFYLKILELNPKKYCHSDSIETK